MIWIGPQNTYTPLHHDLFNNLIIQIAGRKRIILAAPGENPKIYNLHHVFSQIEYPEDPDFTLTNHPIAEGLVTHSIDFGPGDALFISIG